MCSFASNILAPASFTWYLRAQICKRYIFYLHLLIPAKIPNQFLLGDWILHRNQMECAHIYVHSSHSTHISQLDSKPQTFGARLADCQCFANVQHRRRLLLHFPRSFATHQLCARLRQLGWHTLVFRYSNLLIRNNYAGTAIAKGHATSMGFQRMDGNSQYRHVYRHLHLHRHGFLW